MSSSLANLSQPNSNYDCPCLAWSMKMSCAMWVRLQAQMWKVHGLRKHPPFGRTWHLSHDPLGCPSPPAYCPSPSMFPDLSTSRLLRTPCYTGCVSGSLGALSSSSPSLRRASLWVYWLLADAIFSIFIRHDHKALPS